jgi:hypothetical protein
MAEEGRVRDRAARAAARAARFQTDWRDRNWDEFFEQLPDVTFRRYVRRIRDIFDNPDRVQFYLPDEPIQNRDALLATRTVHVARACRFYVPLSEFDFDIPPYLIMAYGVWTLMLRSVELLQGGDQNFYLSSLFASYDNADRPGEYASRMQRPIVVPDNISDLLKARTPFNRQIFEWCSGIIEILFANQIYDGQEVAGLPNAVNRDQLLFQGLHVRLVTNCVFVRRTGFYRENQTRHVNLTNAPVYLSGRNGRVIELFDYNRYAGDFGGKRKMFYKPHEAQFRNEIEAEWKCLQRNPMYEGVFCFPMAFLKSQARIININEGADRVIQVTRPTVGQSPLNIHIPYLRERTNVVNHFHMRDVMYLFNPKLVEEDEMEDWVDCAQSLHEYVQTCWNKELDPTSWEVLQYYSNLFNTVIHVYLKGQVTQFDVYFPDKIPANNIIYHVYMYVDNGHFHPVINIKDFLNSKADSMASYCDCCQKYNSHHGDAEYVKKLYEHIIQCHKKWDFVSKSTKEFIENTQNVNHFKPIQPSYNKEGSILQPYCREHSKFDCPCDHPYKVWEKAYDCRVCGEKQRAIDFSCHHRCYMKAPSPKEKISNEKLFVMDIESMQIPSEYNPNKMVHICVLLCVQAMYDVSIRLEFETIEAFLLAMSTDPRFVNATFLAHNGGGYDYQFLITELEKKGYSYEFVPRPNSDHKYLSLNVTANGGIVRFIDFISLMPGSLRGIAQSFQLEVAKGDFPYTFLKPNTLRYEGAIPPCDSPEDYFCLNNKKNEKDVQEFYEWYAIQCAKYCTCQGPHTCTKQLWNCKDFLKEYCWKDVEVLAQACVKYRDLLLNQERDPDLDWSAVPVDPFQFLTQSQLAMHLFLSGFKELPAIGISIPRKRIHRPYLQYVWFYRLEQMYPQYKFIHFGSNRQEFYWAVEDFYFSCYCPDTNIAYEFIPKEGYDENRKAVLENMLSKRFLKEVIYMREELLGNITPYELNLSRVSEDREFFFGGRTEVFSPYASVTAEDEENMIKYLDVCSLYPTMCSFKCLPTGHPDIIFGSKCDLSRISRIHPDPYFGYVRCKVIPNPHDKLGLLPCKTAEDKLVFDLSPKVGMWFTEELLIAKDNGYHIEEVYEVHHFDVNNRSETLMRGYMSYFLRMKQESEGWKKLGAQSDTPDHEEQLEVMESIFDANGRIGRVRQDRVKKNPVMRQVAKIFLNCLWGKFCQRQKASHFTEVSSMTDYLALEQMDDENMNLSFRRMANGRWRVKYDKPLEIIAPNKKYNIYLAAAVTAQARCYLHSKMISIGPERILYCDTDSIIFLYPKTSPSLAGIGLGKWTDEYPDQEILEFMAIAPKCYLLKLEDKHSIKAKGCIMTVENQKKLTVDSFLGLIESFCIQKQMETVYLKNFSIFPNSVDIQFPYGTMFSRTNEKGVRCVLSKRSLLEDYDGNEVLGKEVHRVMLMPFGYVPEEESTSPSAFLDLS